MHRELALQISEQVCAFGSGMTLRQVVVMGGADVHAQARSLSERPHVVVATPGRLSVRQEQDSSQRTPAPHDAEPQLPQAIQAPKDKYTHVCTHTAHARIY